MHLEINFKIQLNLYVERLIVNYLNFVLSRDAQKYPYLRAVLVEDVHQVLDRQYQHVVDQVTIDD